MPRVISRGGLAASQPMAWRTGTKRWQYAIGAAALAASAMLFWISRVGDRTADAATTSAHEAQLAVPTLADAMMVAAEPSPSVVRSEPRPAAAGVRPSTQTPSKPGAARSEPRSTPPAAARATAVRPLPTARGAAAHPPQAQVRSSPVAPRRGAKVDPDGTFDVYQ
jgi:hypothetical protein